MLACLLALSFLPPWYRGPLRPAVKAVGLEGRKGHSLFVSAGGDECSPCALTVLESAVGMITVVDAGTGIGCRGACALPCSSYEVAW